MSFRSRREFEGGVSFKAKGKWHGRVERETYEVFELRKFCRARSRWNLQNLTRSGYF